ncbi:MAG: T9SS type A sorting domain-containing protein, partial [Candidatus Helarchaeota archaeon]|nr:T9SS type A sorting domain-containing protein [Candidatus Helarchaeota archaeon]
ITAVELVSFEASEIDGKVIIKWETASEENNLGFNILKSQRKDVEFIKVNDALIKSSDEGIYNFTDKDVETGNTYYYILQSVDITGKNRSYQTISITLKIPRQYALYQNYPNPFNPITNVKFDIPKQEKVTLKIYNILGQEIKTLIDKTLEPGSHTVQWDGTNTFGLKVASGIYIYQLKAGKFMKAKKMTLMK